MKSIFISYAAEDFSYAEKIFYFLKEQGFDPWMDKKNLLPGQNWQYILEDTLKKADFILLLISSNSVSKRGYVQREFKRAVDYCEEKLESDIFVIPVKIDSCEVPTSLRRFHWVEYTSEDFKAKIHQAITVQTNVYKRDAHTDKHPEILTSDEKLRNTAPKTKLGIILKKRLIIVSFLIGGCLVAFSISYLPAMFSAQKVSDKLMEKDKVYDFIVDYFDNISSYTEAKRFFADKVTHFYQKRDLTPDGVMKVRKENIEFVDGKHRIDKASLRPISVENDVTYWQFLTNFVCFRRSMNKFETAKVLMEFGINESSKITSIKEIQISNLKFTKDKPTN